MGDCVDVCGVLLVGASSSGVVWVMLCAFPKPVPPSLWGRRKKNTKTTKT